MIVPLLIIGALVFGLCFLVDKGFNRIFRSKTQHISGLSVKHNKRYGSFGLIIFVLGVAAILAGYKEWFMIVSGALLIVVGTGMIVFYMSFGIYYDDDSFLYNSFGKKSLSYQYNQIKNQQLYNSQGNIVIELHMTDGKSIMLQAGMVGVYPFLSTAFQGWLHQTGRKREECTFYDPEHSCWFPPVEV